VKAEHVVAKVGDLPEGAHMVVEAGGRQIGVFNIGGDYYALPNVCFHQNGPLCRGRVDGTYVASEETGWQLEWAHEGEIVICPWHSLEFNIKTGECLAFPNRRLATYEVRVEGEAIKVLL